VTRLVWDDVKEWFDPSKNGSAPDVIVANTDLVDWDRLFELIRSRGWRCEYRLHDQVRALPASAAELFCADTAGRAALSVWPDPHLEWVIRPWSAEEILTDVDLHQIQGQERLDMFCWLLEIAGKALGKRVVVYSEGTSDGGHPPLMAYDVASDHVRFLAGPWS
jgi:hypothetical protein